MQLLNCFLPDNSGPDNLQVDPYHAGVNDLTFRLITGEVVSGLLQPRNEFSHKGTYGHALIVAGETETMGAALLAAQGCLYAGAGLTTACIPESGLIALNTSLPEVMYLSRERFFQREILEKFTTLAIGPGLGKEEEAILMLSNLLDTGRAIIADADALNILASHKPLIEILTKDSILTPHMKEFDAFFGPNQNWYERIQTAVKKARELKIVIVLKNRYTFVINQEGVVNINNSGDPAMAQGGMGDVLTGIIAAYVAQGYSPADASMLGCFLHGAAGADLAIEKINITASELARHLPKITKRYLKVK
jgi:ADP-dependent NAD(P)H-hydrate dehydratase